MRCINFDEQFQRYTAEWMQENADTYGNNLDRMEERMPDVYLQWLNTPADWLDGATPGEYFAREGDIGVLMDWMRAYFERGVPVPDQLLERITALGEAAEVALDALLDDQDAPEEARLTAITLLGELDSARPMARYIAWVAAMRPGDDRAEMAAEALAAMGRRVVRPVLNAMEGATGGGREAFLDILCNYPGEEETWALVLDAFERLPERRALYASLLGKLGDERAIPVLRMAMEEQELNYLDYIELRNALEALGGEAPPERAFDGDPYYESLRGMH